MLDMQGYKSSEEEALKAENIARKILTEELEGNTDISALIGADEHGNVWIYSSEEAKEAASRKVQKATLTGLHPTMMKSSDAISDPGYHSDDGRSEAGTEVPHSPVQRRDSDSAVGLSTPPQSPDHPMSASDPSRNFAKTLRLTSDQLKALELTPGANSMSFAVGRSVCQAFIYLWRADVPVVISDIDGTITKSDVLGHVLNMLGRDWTHLGVAKLYTDIVSNGYNVLYLTSRSVGQADTTRQYLVDVLQEGYRLPKGPVIMSPDRTIAALRREVYLRKPEVFKMACLRDIMGLFGKAHGSPFYAGFGNRFTDALSYRSVNIPQTRIFTINSNSEVSLDLLSLNKYRTGYVSMRELLDHFFPPVTLLVKSGGEDFTDFNYWRDRPLGIDEFSASESEDDGDEEDAALPSQSVTSLRSEDQYENGHVNDDDFEGEGEDLENSYISRDSMDDSIADSIIENVEGGRGDSNEPLALDDGLVAQSVELTQEEAAELLRRAKENGELDEGGGDAFEADYLDDASPFDEGARTPAPAVTSMKAGSDRLQVDLNELAHVLNESEERR